MRRLVPLLAALVGMAFGGTLAAQTPGPNLNALIDETQQRSPEPHDVTVVWWLPEEFWRASAANNPKAPPEALDSITLWVHPYVIVAVVSAQMAGLGHLNYVTGDSIRSSIALVDSTGATRRPLPDSAISQTARQLIAFLGPVMANMLGNLGQNMNFYLFDGRDARGSRILDPSKPGRFSLRVLGHDYRWRLPLGSLVPRKRCPVDGEMLSGAWTFCPYHGTKLEAAP